MSDKATYYMWNFENIWDTDLQGNDGYPFINLRGEEVVHELEGYGDKDSPYLIYTEEDLWTLADGTYNIGANLYFELQNDIVVSARHWTPIGANGKTTFKSTFDGNGYTISGLQLSNHYYDDIGLFGINEGTIKNLRVEAIFDGEHKIGALCAENYGTIDNCSSSGLIMSSTIDQYEAGGLVGYNAGTISFSYSNATVTTAAAYAGGLVGKNHSGGTIQCCYATGRVAGSYAGGLVGHNLSQDRNKPARIQNAYAIGKVTGTNYAGGLIGFNQYGNGNTLVEYCYSNGHVLGSDKKGGLIGWLGAYGSGANTVTSCYYDSITSEMSDLDRGTPLDSNAMKTESSYVGWDYNTIWAIDPQVNKGYPFIWEMEPESTANVSGVSLNYSELEVQAETVVVLIATITPANAQNKAIVWTSSSEELAYVSNGRVTTKGAGIVTITATTADGGYSASCTLTITKDEPPIIPVTGVTLSETSIEVAQGSTYSVIANILPEDATDKGVTWTSSKTSVATVANGVVTGVATGNATVTATTNDGGYTATCRVRVVAAPIDEVPVTGVTLNKESLTLDQGASETLTATVLPTNATNKSVTWTSSKQTVATVTASGKVTTVAPGSAVITVQTNDGSYTATCTVTVPEPVVPGENGVITVSDATARTGESVDVDVVFEKNPGINTFSFGIEYDADVLTLDSVTINPAIGGQFTYAKKAVWLNSSDSIFTGTVLTLHFTAPENAPLGDTAVSVSYNSGDIGNYEEEDVDFTIHGGTVTVIDYIPGDINGDGNVNNKDLTRLMKYLAGEDVTVVEVALDTNGDGNVNNKDLTRLMKYLAGEDVVLN